MAKYTLGTFPDAHFRCPKFHSLPREKNDKRLFIGVELEMESKKANYNPILETIDAANDAVRDPLWVYKQDGSLENGVECVTQPFTWQYYTQRMKLEPVFSELNKHAAPFTPGGRRTAGFHVHMSRKAFDQPHLLRFLKFHRANAEFCATALGRGINAYWGSLAPISRASDEQLARASLNHEFHTFGRTGVNLTNNKGTIELRYFQSTLNVKRFKAIVEWVFALYNYTKKADAVLTAGGFRGYVRSAQTKYPNLYAALAKDKAYNEEQWVRGGVLVA